MAGYLDRDFGNGFGVDARGLRGLLSRISSLETPNLQVFGFGERLTPVSAISNQDVLAQLVNQEFYRDNNTRLEDVIDAIAADTARRFIHIVITDGRRGDGGAAIAQYRALGALARHWVGSNRLGVFALGATLAPFKQVRNDRAGCWSSAANELFPCPLYVFAFAPTAASLKMLDLLKASSERLYVVPTPSDGKAMLRVERRSGTGLHVFEKHAPGEALLLMYRAERREGVDTVGVTVVMSAVESVARFSVDDSLQIEVAVRPLDGRGSWQPFADYARGWVKPASPVVQPNAAIALPVVLRARSQLTPTAYRVRLSSTGLPSWLARFNVERQGDSTKTYGLTALFDQLQRSGAPVAQFYVGVY
jgi:hypothetical protein